MCRINNKVDYKKCSVFCFSETWLTPSHPDSSLQPPGFTVYRQDRDPAITKMHKGGGVCFLINNNWCTDIRIISSGCTPDMEYLTIKCRPFYLPREFSSVTLTSAYIHPRADTCTDVALTGLSEVISNYENADSGTLSKVAGDFNKANSSSTLPPSRDVPHARFRNPRSLLLSSERSVQIGISSQSRQF